LQLGALQLVVTLNLGYCRLLHIGWPIDI
jgi:hypothetical protein